MQTTWRGLLAAGLAMLLGCATSLATAADKPSPSDSGGAPAAEAEQQEAFLGVAVERLHPAFWTHWRHLWHHEQGVLVSHVAPGSPAAEAGLEPHDIILSYGDQKLFAPEQLAALVRADRPGQEVQLRVLHEGQPVDKTVTLGGHPVMKMPPVAPQLPPRGLRPITSHRPPAWSTFDSLSLKSLGNNRFRVEIEYESTGNKIEHRVFEGTIDEIRKDILARQDLPASERSDLLEALQMSGGDPALDFPTVYFGPGGRLIWDFGRPSDF